MRCYVFFTPFKYVDIYFFVLMHVHPPSSSSHWISALLLLFLKHFVRERKGITFFSSSSLPSSSHQLHFIPWWLSWSHIYLSTCCLFFLHSLKYVTRKKSCMSCHQTQREEKDNKYVKYFQKKLLCEERCRWRITSASSSLFVVQVKWSNHRHHHHHEHVHKFNESFNDELKSFERWWWWWMFAQTDSITLTVLEHETMSFCLYPHNILQ